MNQNQKPKSNQNQKHQPVLLDSLIDLLQPEKGERYLDLTAGYGGHADAVLKLTGGKPRHILIDRDHQVLDHLRGRFGSGVTVMHSDFESALHEVKGRFDIVVADLGVSSPQLDNPNRGFSFQQDGPLDMRMNQAKGKTAAELLNSLSERDIADLIYRYSQEHQSRRIAAAIVQRRPVTTTRELADIVSSAVVKRGGSGKRIHPATRTFQALRIAVNDELGQLERSLPMMEKVLRPGGRLAVISFHSLEDKTVKSFIRDSTSLDPVNKKVIQGKFNDVSNPRARSAKLRAAIKNTNQVDLEEPLPR